MNSKHPQNDQKLYLYFPDPSRRFPRYKEILRKPIACSCLFTILQVLNVSFFFFFFSFLVYATRTACYLISWFLEVILDSTSISIRYTRPICESFIFLLASSFFVHFAFLHAYGHRSGLCALAVTPF